MANGLGPKADLPEWVAPFLFCELVKRTNQGLYLASGEKILWTQYMELSPEAIFYLAS